MFWGSMDRWGPGWTRDKHRCEAVRAACEAAVEGGLERDREEGGRQHWRRHLGLASGVPSHSFLGRSQLCVACVGCRHLLQVKRATKESAKDGV